MAQFMKPEEYRGGIILAILVVLYMTLFIIYMGWLFKH